jgi:hypothetical protein
LPRPAAASDTKEMKGEKGREIVRQCPYHELF